MTGVDWLDTVNDHSLAMILKTDSLGYYDETGIGELEWSGDLDLFLSPNPSARSFSAVFTLTEPALVDLAVYDLSGRCVLESSGNGFDAGRNEVTVGGLASGIYLVRVTSGSLEGTGKMVVLNR